MRESCTLNEINHLEILGLSLKWVRSLHELNWIWFMFWRMIVYNKKGSISTYTAFFSCLHNVDEKEYEPRMRLTNEKSLYSCLADISSK